MLKAISEFNISNHRASFIKYWAKKWHLAKLDLSKKSSSDFFNDPSYWDGMAASYMKKTGDKDLQQIYSEVADFIIRTGLVTEESHVLDIGCGVGTYTIPLAKVAKSVTALDPSKKMLNFLVKRAKKEGLRNIQTIASAWNKDIALRLRKGFDFTLASLCPGVSDIDALIQMQNTSRCYCSIIGFNNSTSADFTRFWKDITGEELGDNFFEIVFPLNLLYGLSIPVNLKTFSYYYTPKIESNKARSNFERLFSQFMRLDADKKKIIHDYVKAHSQRGIFNKRNLFRLGLLWWESNTVI